MDKTSPRPLQRVRSEWSTPQLLEALQGVLNGDGPALSFGGSYYVSDFTSVSNDCAVVIPTSGSTAIPKFTALSAAGLIASTRASLTYLDASDGDCWSLLLPTTHIAGVNVLMRALELNSEIVGVESAADFTAIVPTQLHRALHGDTQLLEHLQNTKAVLVGGSATSTELINSAAMLGINVITTYGMTEMSGGCIYNGTSLTGVDLRIVDGVIELNGPMKAIGYLGEDRFNDGYFRTSDAGQIVDGKLEVLGRLDDQIISGGEKISLGAISDFLEVGTSQRFIAVGLPDLEWGQALAIASDGPLDEAVIRERLRIKFGVHASPKRYLANIELPLTSLGKADRKRLVELFGRLR